MLLDTPDAAIPDSSPASKPPLATPQTAFAPLPEPGSPTDDSDKRDRAKGESGDDYPGVRFHVPGTNWRVAACSKGYCWLLQQRRAKDHWESRKYFSNRHRLAVVVTELVGEQAAATVKDKVEALPI